MKLSIVIPLFNEVPNIPRISTELLPVVRELAIMHWVEVIFVDDGSTDGTFAELSRTFLDAGGPRLRFGIARHPTNRGLGAALRTGFATSIGEIIVTVDSDGSYEFKEIPALVFCLNPNADIVTASPYHRDGKVEGVPARRLILSRGCSLIYRVLVDWRIRTYTSLFRAYRREVVERVPFVSDGYQAVTEVLVKAMLLGYQTKEYPAVLRSRSFGMSNVNLVGTIIDHLRFQWTVLLYRAKLKSLDIQEESKAAS